MKISDCCASPVIPDALDRNICTGCGEPCNAREEEEEKPFKFYGLTSRARAGMRQDVNGDMFVDD